MPPSFDSLEIKFGWKSTIQRLKAGHLGVTQAKCAESAHSEAHRARGANTESLRCSTYRQIDYYLVAAVLPFTGAQQP